MTERSQNFRKVGVVRHFLSRTGDTKIYIPDLGLTVTLNSANFVGDSTNRLPREGDSVIVNFENNRPVSGLILA